MRTSFRGAERAVRLSVETLEDRLTPAVAYALNAVLGGGTLLAFDTANPAVTTPIAISVDPSETLVGIDFRPQNGHLYGLGVNATTGNGTLYDISTRTGQATAVGAIGSVDPTAALPDPATAGYGFDFNPTVDRIRVVTTNGQSFRVNPNTGVVTTNDPTLNPVATADGSAYTNNVPNATMTVLYALDAGTDTLYIQDAALSTLTPVGALGVNFSSVNGFDITSTGTAFAALTVSGQAGLYSINLATGAATLVGTIGAGGASSGLAVQSDLGGFPAIGLDATGVTAFLIRFNTATPGATPTPVTVSGLALGDVLVGIDFRPQTGQLFGLGVNPGTGNGTLYRIDPQDGSATAIGAPGTVDLATALPDPATAGYGFDFNPTVDRLRVVTSTGLNFRINPIDGSVLATDTVISGSGSAGVSAAAYTNSYGQLLSPTSPTTLYTLDSTLNMLFIQNPPNSGIQTIGKTVTLNGSTLDFTEVNGFDIPAGVQVATGSAVAAGFGYASLVVGGTTFLYRIDLATGAATNLGAVNGNPSLDGLALGDAPTGIIGFQSATFSVTETGKNASVVLTRTSGSGPVTVTVSVVGGTAIAGTDFTGGPYTVTFADGQMSAVLSIPILNDTAVEGNETIVLLVTAAPGGAISGQTATTVTIIDDDPRLDLVLGTGAGLPFVTAFNLDGSLRFAFAPYGPNATGGVRVARGDVTGDGVDDIVTVPGVGPAVVLAFDGVSGARLGSFTALAGYTGGASLAVGDLNGDGKADIIVGATTGLAVVEAYSGADLSSLGSFLPFGNFLGGANVAAGDLNGDGRADVIAGMASGGGIVAGFSGADLSSLGSFFAAPGLTGVTLAVVDLNNDGKLDILTGYATGLAVVRAFSGVDLSSLGSFTAFAGAAVGVNVTGTDVNGDGRPDLILGSASGIAVVEGYDGTNLAFLGSVLPFGALNGGVFVG